MSVVAGFGFRGTATVESLSDALERAGHASSITGLATATDKAGAKPFVELAKIMKLPVHAVDHSKLSEQETLTRSLASLKARNVGSLSEAAALAGAGPGAELLGVRVTSADGMATCALARGRTT